MRWLEEGGKAVPSGQTKVLQHLEGGIVSEILVKEGDSVKANQLPSTNSTKLFLRLILKVKIWIGFHF